MHLPADRGGGSRRSSIATAMGPARLAQYLALALALFGSASASAQVVASVTLSNDVRFRGRSITDGEPAITADIGYDDRSGVYVAASATMALSGDGPEFVNFQENLGFAHRLGSGLTIDLGIVRSDYTQYYSGGRKAHFTEFYAGFRANRVTAYLRYSPDYFRPGVETLYGEINATIEPAQQWRLIAHAGALVQLAGPLPPEGDGVGYDWKLGLARDAGAFEFQLAVSGGGPGPDYRQGQRHDRTAVTASLTWTL